MHSEPRDRCPAHFLQLQLSFRGMFNNLLMHAIATTSNNATIYVGTSFQGSELRVG